MWHICVETSPGDGTGSFPQRALSLVIRFDLIRGTVTVLVSDNIPLIDLWHLKYQCVTETRVHFSTMQPTGSRWDYCDRGEIGYINWMEKCARFSNSPITMQRQYQYCPRTVIWLYQLVVYTFLYLGRMYLINRYSPKNTFCSIGVDNVSINAYAIRYSNIYIYVFTYVIFTMGSWWIHIQYHSSVVSITLGNKFSFANARWPVFPENDRPSK